MSVSRVIAGRPVGPIGFGALSLSVEGRPDRDSAREVVAAALDSGVTLFDTADCYGIGPGERGHNERLLRECFDRLGVPTRSVMVATKGGHHRTRSGRYATDGRPAALRAACEQSLRALGTDVIDLYFFHRPDPAVPFADSIGAIHELKRAGKVRAVGVSNVDVDELRLAMSITDVGCVQNRLSLACPGDLPMARECGRLGIAYVPWAPIGGFGRGGELSGAAPAARSVADRHGVPVPQVALAWLLSLGPHVVPIPGTRRPPAVRENSAAWALELDAADLRSLDASAGWSR